MRPRIADRVPVFPAAAHCGGGRPCAYPTRMRSSAARSASGSAAGRRVARSTKTWTNHPSAAAESVARREDAHLVAHARSPDRSHPQTRREIRGEAHRLRGTGSATRRHPDDRTRRDVEPSGVDEVAVDDRVEVAVVDDVVDVPVHVVIHPPRRHDQEVGYAARVSAAASGLGSWSSPVGERAAEERGEVRAGHRARGVVDEPRLHDGPGGERLEVALGVAHAGDAVGDAGGPHQVATRCAGQHLARVAVRRAAHVGAEPRGRREVPRRARRREGAEDAGALTMTETPCGTIGSWSG